MRRGLSFGGARDDKILWRVCAHGRSDILCHWWFQSAYLRLLVCRLACVAVLHLETQLPGEHRRKAFGRVCVDRRRLRDLATRSTAASDSNLAHPYIDRVPCQCGAHKCAYHTPPRPATLNPKPSTMTLLKHGPTKRQQDHQVVRHRRYPPHLSLLLPIAHAARFWSEARRGTVCTA